MRDKMPRIPALISVLLIIIFSTFPISGQCLFGTKEKSSSNLKSFPKWKGMLDRYFKEDVLIDGSCDDTDFNKCHLKEWNKFLQTIKNKDSYTQVKEVNHYINNVKYITDPLNWGVADYWATPYQFYVKDGDCEDYAISKFMSLRALGFSNDDMRIVVLNDENLRVVHAVLAVYIGNRIYILDNQVKQVLEDTQIHHYQPVYSINETTWWRHR